MKRILQLTIACVLSAVLPTGALGRVSVQAGGAIQGHIRLTGTPPRNSVIQMGADPNCLTINAGKRVFQETVLKGADDGLANVFVMVKGSFPQSPAPSTPVVIDQRGCLYHPRVQGARVGQTLEVKNSDKTLHNIHGWSDKKNDFNVGQPVAGMVNKFQLKNEEVMLKINCDVHKWMSGYIGVVTHPYFTVTDATGAFTIANVPAGKQTVQVWHELYGPLTLSVDVKAGSTTTADFTYTANEKPSAAAFPMQELVIPEGVIAIELVAHTR